MRNAEWAIITTRMMPKERASPAASRAYSPPRSRPRMTLWKTSIGRSPGRLRIDQVGLLGLGREHDLDVVADPLLDHVGALRVARGVPFQRADDRLDRVAVQPVDQLLLALPLLGAPGRLDRGRHDLASGVAVGLV